METKWSKFKNDSALGGEFRPMFYDYLHLLLYAGFMLIVGSVFLLEFERQALIESKPVSNVVIESKPIAKVKVEAKPTAIERKPTPTERKPTAIITSKIAQDVDSVEFIGYREVPSHYDVWYSLQVATLSSLENAQHGLKKYYSNEPSSYIAKRIMKNQTWYCIMVGRFSSFIEGKEFKKNYTPAHHSEATIIRRMANVTHYSDKSLGAIPF